MIGLCHGTRVEAAAPARGVLVRSSGQAERVAGPVGRVRVAPEWMRVGSKNARCLTLRLSVAAVRVWVEAVRVSGASESDSVVSGRMRGASAPKFSRAEKNFSHSAPLYPDGKFALLVKRKEFPSVFQLGHVEFTRRRARASDRSRNHGRPLPRAVRRTHVSRETFSIPPRLKWR